MSWYLYPQGLISSQEQALPKSMRAACISSNMQALSLPWRQAIYDHLLQRGSAITLSQKENSIASSIAFQGLS